METPVSLYELNLRIKRLVSESMSPVWVMAEIADIMHNRSGHCYLQLAQKGEDSDQPLAVAKATIWAFTYRTLAPYFESVTGRQLCKGMNVMFLAEPVFHELYGFSLNIKDIEPSFTIGDIERRRREVVEKLTADGVMEMNRRLEFPILPQRIAVISSPTAAGWGDFKDHLLNNSYGFAFSVKLFPAVMQGESAERSIIDAFDAIFREADSFDAVVIIRGGGAQTEISCFDSYELGACAAQFPLPVISGIGHERDVTVMDLVSHTRVKTPTAAADLFINRFVALESGFCDAASRLKRAVVLYIKEETAGCERTDMRLRHVLQNIFISENTELIRSAERVSSAANRSLENGAFFIEKAETVVRYADPARIIERGFSVTRINGKTVRCIAEAKPGDTVVTILRDGEILSTVKETEYGKNLV